MTTGLRLSSARNAAGLWNAFLAENADIDGSSSMQRLASLRLMPIRRHILHGETDANRRAQQDLASPGQRSLFGPVQAVVLPLPYHGPMDAFILCRRWFYRFLSLPHTRWLVHYP